MEAQKLNDLILENKLHEKPAHTFSKNVSMKLKHYESHN